jgi:two-component system, cell cycle sensor histidine kinase and response regulator CckA
MEAVGQLAGGIAHDFNNLLNIIIGYCEVALERHNLSEPVKGIMTEVRKAGERAASLTRQLLAFSRKQMLAPEVLDLNEVTRDISDMVRRMVSEDIRVETACADGLWRVRADPDQIAQVIMNLASNARDAMPNGGRLTIRASNVELTRDSTERRATMPVGKYVLLAVSDTGTGMDSRTQSHLFEPFFSTKEKGKGTGLGLATVYGVKQSEGYVWVESEVGRGSSFKIYLPRVEGAPDRIQPVR